MKKGKVEFFGVAENIEAIFQEIKSTIKRDNNPKLKFVPWIEEGDFIYTQRGEINNFLSINNLIDEFSQNNS